MQRKCNVFKIRSTVSLVSASGLQPDLKGTWYFLWDSNLDSSNSNHEPKALFWGSNPDRRQDSNQTELRSFSGTPTRPKEHVPFSGTPTQILGL